MSWFPTPSRLRGALFAALGAALLAGCTINVGGPSGTVGAGSTTRFDVEGYDITFDYPSTLLLTEDVTFDESAGGTGGLEDKDVALALDGSSIIAVSRLGLRGEVTPSNIGAVRAEMDAVVAQLDPTAGAGRSIELGGLPGFEYQLAMSDGKQSRYLVGFDRSTQYTINCQYTEQGRDAITEACRTIERTLQRR